ncbi:MAG: class I tRNA ligase family protein, partial [Sciscionella sp.]
AKAAGEAVRDGSVAVHPPEMSRRYFDWVDNMHDWCISRQLWWGHRIPVWYGPNGEIRCLGPDEEPPNGPEWIQDEDVLDTWFSAGLWPFSTLGWPERTPDLERFYPTSVLVTGYDILFFWVARMMMFGLYAMDGVPPFRTIVLHGMVRDASGRKMSKSAGNTVDPLGWMDRYGTDALRFTLTKGANPGADVPVSEEWVRSSRNFGTKLWNATRFALIKGARVDNPVPARDALTEVDRWITDRLDSVVAEVGELLDDYQFAKATETLYHFTWDELCDWYLELAKIQFDEGDGRAEATRSVLGHVLDVVLRLLHPFMPFISETLWTGLTGGESLVIAEWPKQSGSGVDGAASERMVDLRKLVTEIRRFRSDQGLKPGQRVAARLSGVDMAGLAAHLMAIRELSRLDEPSASFTPSASIEVRLSSGMVDVRLDLSGTVDIAAERKRLTKDLGAAEKELATCDSRLADPSFTDRAPAEVVAKIKTRRDVAAGEIDGVRARLAALPAG